MIQRTSMLCLVPAPQPGRALYSKFSLKSLPGKRNDQCFASVIEHLTRSQAIQTLPWPVIQASIVWIALRLGEWFTTAEWNLSECFLDLFKTANDTNIVVPNETNAVDELRQAELRVTAPRLAVLEWLYDHPHATAEQVFQGVSRRLGSVSMQAVYDVLAACHDAGLVRRIELAGHSARFERRTGDSHHHVTCRSCGRIEDVDCVAGAQPCLSPSERHRFEVDEVEVVFWGICPDCRAAGTPARQDSNSIQDAEIGDRSNYSTRNRR